MTSAVPTLQVSEAARDPRVHPATRTMLRVAAAFAVATVATGAINSATGSGFACSTWPGCHAGHFAPHPEVHQVIEFGHRAIAAGCALTVLAAAVMGLRLPRSQRLARLFPWVAVLGIFGSALFGAITVLNLGLAKPLAVLDLTCALTTMVAMTLATLSLERGAPVWHWTRLSRLATLTGAGIVLVHLLGMVLAGPSSFTAVLGWPLWRMVPRDLAPWLQVVRMALAVVTGLLLVAVTGLASRIGSLRWVAATTLALLVVELVVGQVILAQGLSMSLAALHAGLAALVLFGVLLLAGRAGLEGR